MKIDDVYMFGRPRGPMPVERRLVAKRKAEAPKCKTCIYFGCAHCCHEPMGMACEDYKRKKKKK